MKANKKYGFTLIEMLIVIVIILILSGMVLKIMTVVARKASVAHCAHDLLQIENALAEYYSEYGQYPPGIDPNGQRNVDYEFENTMLQSSGLRTLLQNHSNLNNIANFFPDVIVYTDYIPNYLEGIPRGHQADINTKDKTQYHTVNDLPKKWGLGYHYGLVSHLWLRDRGGSSSSRIGDQKHWYREDTERDKAVKKRWAHFLTDLTYHYREYRRHHVDGHGLPSSLGSGAYEAQHTDLGGNNVFSNNVYTVMDPWWHGYYYECKPPYYSYKLWSSGPDGLSYSKNSKTKEDDIYAGNNN